MKDLVQKALENLNRKGDGDTIDRLSATTTVTMLIVAAFAVTAGQVVAQPIHCFVPAEMTRAMKDYVEHYCYVQETYFLPYEQPLPQTRPFVQRKGVQVVSYYQWVPFILLLQAFMFYMPRLLWRVASSVSGVNFNAMLIMARQCLACDDEKRDHNYRALADYVNWALRLHRAARQRGSCSELCDRMGSHHVIVVCILSKTLYVVNAIGQIFLLDVLLQTRDPLYGITMVQQLINGTQWQTSGLFPRSTLCDLEIRDTISGNLNRHTVQCVLMTNVLNEKLFIFFWFWTMLVAVASFCNLVYYLLTVCFPGNRRRFVRRLLPELPVDKNHPLADSLTKFADDYLGSYGVFLLRSISERVGSIVASKVATLMWRDFMQFRDPKSATFSIESGNDGHHRNHGRDHSEQPRSSVTLFLQWSLLLQSLLRAPRRIQPDAWEAEQRPRNPNESSALVRGPPQRRQAAPTRHRLGRFDIR